MSNHSRQVAYRLPIPLLEAIDSTARAAGVTKTELVIQYLSEALGLVTEDSAMGTGLHHQVEVLTHEIRQQGDRLTHLLALLSAQQERVERLESTLFDQIQQGENPRSEDVWLTKEEAFNLLEAKQSDGSVSDLYGRSYRWNTFRKLPSGEYPRFGFEHNPERAASKEPCLRMTPELRQRLLYQSHE